MCLAKDCCYCVCPLQTWLGGGALGSECLLSEAEACGEGQGLFSQATATVSWPQWILPIMCFPKRPLDHLCSWLILKMMSSLAAMLVWDAL